MNYFEDHGESSDAADKAQVCPWSQIFRRRNESRLYIANNPVDYQANLVDFQFQLHLYKGRRFLVQTLLLCNQGSGASINGRCGGQNYKPPAKGRMDQKLSGWPTI